MSGGGVSVQRDELFLTDLAPSECIMGNLGRVRASTECIRRCKTRPGVQTMLFASVGSVAS